VINELGLIRAKLHKLNISLQETRDLWFQAKSILQSANHLDGYDFESSMVILNKVQEIVDNFIKK
jgi:hypothetical protein